MTYHHFSDRQKALINRWLDSMGDQSTRPDIEIFIQRGDQLGLKILEGSTSRGWSINFQNAHSILENLIEEPSPDEEAAPSINYRLAIKAADERRAPGQKAKLRSGSRRNDDDERRKR